MMEVYVAGVDLLRYVSATQSVYDVYAVAGPEPPGPLMWPPAARMVLDTTTHAEALTVGGRPLTWHRPRDGLPG